MVHPARHKGQAMRIEKARRPAIGGAAHTGAARHGDAASGFGAVLDAAGEDATPTAASPLQISAPCGAAAPVCARLDYDTAMLAVAADRQARRHGRAMLRALGALQLAMLGAEGDGASRQLAVLAAEIPPADDPVLRLILREIGVRAAVALGRHEAKPNVSSG